VNVKISRPHVNDDVGLSWHFDAVMQTVARTVDHDRRVLPAGALQLHADIALVLGND
jgi:hypothetical protein